MYITFDDCFQRPLLKYDIEAHLQNGDTIILNDPRFCILTKFRKIFNHIQNLLHSERQIRVIYFENNLKQCVSNKKNQYIGLNLNFEPDCSDIIKFSKQYNTTIKYLRSHFPTERLSKRQVYCVPQKPIRPPRQTEDKIFHSKRRYSTMYTEDFQSYCQPSAVQRVLTEARGVVKKQRK